MTQLKDLTSKFRHVRLLLAREKGRPTGDREEGYDLLVPLDEGGHLDAAEWKTHQEHCRVRHFKAGEDDRIGRLRRKPGGQWYFDYAERDDHGVVPLDCAPDIYRVHHVASEAMQTRVG